MARRRRAHPKSPARLRARPGSLGAARFADARAHRSRSARGAGADRALRRVRQHAPAAERADRPKRRGRRGGPHRARGAAHASRAAARLRRAKQAQGLEEAARRLRAFASPAPHAVREERALSIDGVVSGPVTFPGYPPGPAPARHLLESLRGLDDLRRDVLGTVGQRFATYGDLYYAEGPDVEVYSTCHPDLIQQVLVTQARSFRKRTRDLEL